MNGLLSMRSVARWTSQEVAIDMGTANTLFYLKGRGIVLNEPSLVVVEDTMGVAEPKLRAFGADAREMIGRTPRNLRLVRPLQRGMIADFSATQKMLGCFLSKSLRRRLWRARVMISIPAVATSVEARAFREVVANLPGVRSVSTVPDPLAGAHGVGLPIGSPTGCMLVDIGAGVTECTVLSRGGIVITRSIPVAGNAIDERILSHLRGKFNLMIGDRTAEQLKIKVGSAKLLDEQLSVMVTGHSLSSGLPRTIMVQTNEIYDAIAGVVGMIVELVHRVLEVTPPELSADIFDRGIALTGGGSLLRNLSVVLSERMGVPVSLAAEPMTSVACGAAELMGDRTQEHQKPLLARIAREAVQ